MAEASESRPIRVLVVCTANICRSPMAAGFLRAAGPHLEVRSAGFLREGQPAARHAITVMREYGIDISDHVSQTVTPDHIVRADLILTMERQHARDVLLAHPCAYDRTFTLKCFQDLVASEPNPQRSPLREYVQHLAKRRPRSALLGTGIDDISDPYGRSIRHFRRTAKTLSTLAIDVANALGRL